MIETITKQCNKCDRVLPLAEFHKHPHTKDRLQAHCRECHVKLYRNQHIRGVSTIESHNLVIAELGYHGIYSCAGSGSVFRHVDIVAWGCIQIEVKSSTLNKSGMFHFSFSASQFSGGLKAELIVLVCLRPTVNSFHVFDPQRPLFFRKDGKMKTAISWTPGGAGKRNRHTTDSLTDKTMRNSESAWWMVEKIRREKSEELRDPEQMKLI